MNINFAAKFNASSNRYFVWFLALSSFFFLPSCKETTAQSYSTEKNAAALLQAEQNIEKYRKGDAQIEIFDAKGKPLINAKIRVKQLSHDFKFGGYLKIDDLAPEKIDVYEQSFARLFNYAVVGTYWDFIENKQGAENWDWFVRETEAARKMNLKIQFAPVIWGTNQAGTPSWLPRRQNELAAAINRHIEKVLSKAESAEDLEIVNEPLAPKKDVFAPTAGKEYIANAFRQARRIAPTKRLLINEYGVFGADSERRYNRDKYYALLQKMIGENVPFDVIGIQAHANGEWFAPANVAEQLAKYATLGKPLQITEFSAQTLEYDDRKTAQNIDGNYQSGIWNDEKQAEFYRQFYTVAFGNPQVEAIIQWGIDDERAWLPGIGLLDEKFQPKANFKMLDRLINRQWHTELPLETTKNAAVFRGFYGVYEVEIIVGGKTVKTKFELKKGVQNHWTIKV